ncbi:hypothetical protein VB713_01895 [Anabaena cylindrica UHCC 0172]|uniref:hypothetical protein n=1 Tax=Anabaena cylindrica TaxID=1165 RepID=UPI002B20444E|nr:hypothetical protein [Anabaena cylindrica]MEA5549743.1 hypothetical protein [Anabaena cylindrica UHCC 0172]
MLIHIPKIAIALRHPKKRYLRSTSLSHPITPKQRSHFPYLPTSDRISTSQYQGDHTPISPKAIAPTSPKRAIALPHIPKAIPTECFAIAP